MADAAEGKGDRDNCPMDRTCTSCKEEEKEGLIVS